MYNTYLLAISIAPISFSVIVTPTRLTSMIGISDLTRDGGSIPNFSDGQMTGSVKLVNFRDTSVIRRCYNNFRFTPQPIDVRQHIVRVPRVGDGSAV